jgi:hypothetical protein
MKRSICTVLAILALTVIANAQGKWEVKGERNAMDDSTTVSAGLEADNEISNHARAVRPGLAVRCKSHKFEIFVFAGMPPSVEHGKADRHTVQLRLDQAPAFTEDWTVSTSRHDLFASHPDRLLKQLLDAQTFLFGFTPFGGNPAVVTFDVRGLADVIGQVQNACTK